jgi:hypothetical protein
MKGFLKFKKFGEGNWWVYNHKGEILGSIAYHSRWKRFVFEPDDTTFFDAECLLKIIEKLNKLQKLKNGRNKKR